jgi:Flp pilus assembly protein TadG
MKRPFKTPGRQSEHGVVAIEAAFVLPFLVIFLWLPSILLAFYFRQYTAVQKAAHDAAIYLSTAPRLEMTTTGPDGNFAALTVAKRIVARELAGIVPAGTAVDPDIYCIYRVAATTSTRPCTPAILKLDTHTLLRFDVGINVPYVNPLTGKNIDSMYMSILDSVRYLGT